MYGMKNNNMYYQSVITYFILASFVDYEKKTYYPVCPVYKI